MSTPSVPTGAWRQDELRLATGLLARAALPESPAHEPLLLVHGIAGGAWYWEHYLRFFAERGWPTYALELRGRAGSRTVAELGRVSLQDYVDDVREVAAALGRPAVIGHSMGGLFAQKLAEADLVSATVLLSSMPPKGIRYATPALALRQLRHVWTMLRERPLVGRPEDLERLTLNRVPAAERAAMARRFLPDSGRVARELSLGGLPVDPSRVRAPMLSISTAEDRFFSPAVGRQVAARYHCPMWLYEGHAHFSVMEPGWEAIAGDIARWLAHVPVRAEQAAAYDRLWAALQSKIGEDVELRFLDGRRVLAEVVNVDLSRYRDVLFEVRETRAPGDGHMVRPPQGEVERAELGELVALHAADGTALARIEVAAA